MWQTSGRGLILETSPAFARRYWRSQRKYQAAVRTEMWPDVEVLTTRPRRSVWRSVVWYYHTKRPDALQYCNLSFRQTLEAMHVSIYFALRRKPQFVALFHVAQSAPCRGYCGIVRFSQRCCWTSMRHCGIVRFSQRCCWTFMSSEDLSLQLHDTLILHGFFSDITASLSTHRRREAKLNAFWVAQA
jgi:hypothetical protein